MKQDALNNNLLSAAKNGEIEKVNALILQGANINAIDESGKTPLYLAIEKDKTGVALYLIEKRADLKLTGENKFGPIHIAVLKDNAEVVEALTKKGVAEENPIFNPTLIAFIGYSYKIDKIAPDDTASLESVNKNFDRVIKALLKGKADTQFLEEQTKKITGSINDDEREEATDALFMLGGVISDAKASGQNAGSSASPATSAAEMENNILEVLFGNLSIAKAGAGPSASPSSNSSEKRGAKNLDNERTSKENTGLGGKG